jgi:hypothetical protein
MHKRMVLVTLLAVGVVGQTGLRANTVLFAFLPLTGVVNGALGSTVWRFDLQPLSEIVGPDSLYWPQKHDGVFQPTESYQFGPAVTLGVEDIGSNPFNRRKFDRDLSSGSASLIGTATTSASSALAVSLELAPFGLVGLGLALLAWGIRPPLYPERLHVGELGRHAVSGHVSQVLITESHRGSFLNLKSSVTQPPAFSEGSLSGSIRSLYGCFSRALFEN